MRTILLIAILAGAVLAQKAAEKPTAYQPVSEPPYMWDNVEKRWWFDEVYERTNALKLNEFIVLYKSLPAAQRSNVITAAIKIAETNKATLVATEVQK